VNSPSHPEAATARRSVTREPTSRVDQLARALRRAALLLAVAFIVAAVTAIIWVDNEITDPPLWRYITAVADEGIFLVGAVIAWVGSAIVEALGRVRASLLDAMEQQSAPTAQGGVPMDEWQ
jgi:cytochrome bd-type quinol oxidase subunit 2